MTVDTRQRPVDGPEPLTRSLGPPAKVTSAQRPLPSTQLLGGNKSVAIEHQGVIYRLQVTKLGKLILTK